MIMASNSEDLAMNLSECWENGSSTDPSPGISTLCLCATFSPRSKKLYDSETKKLPEQNQ